MTRPRLCPWIIVAFACALVSAGCDLFVNADTRVSRADEHITQRDYRAAMIELKNALQSEPDHVGARLLLAQVSLHLGDAPAAEKELRRAIESGAKPVEAADIAARTRLALGQQRELLAQIDSGELPLAEPARSIFRGRALLALREPDLAMQAFQTASGADAASVTARIGLAEAQAAKGRSQEAVDTLAAVLQASPGNGEAMLVMGGVLAAQGRFPEAEKSLQAAQASNTDFTIRQQALLLTTLAEARLASGNVAGARESHNALAQIASTAPVTLMLAARIAMTNQDYAAASAELQRIVAAVPDLISARFLLGAALLAQGNLYQAESQLTRVVHKAPENLEARKLLAQVRLRLGQPDAAMQVLMPAQSTASETDPEINTLLGLAQLQLGNPGNAVQFLERSAATRPGDRKLQLDLARTYLRSGDNQKAVNLLRSLPPLDDDLRREALLVSAVIAASGVDAGRTEMDKLLAARPRNIAVLNLASSFYAQRGEYERARSYVGQALSLRPDDAATLLNSARVELAAGNPAAAAGRLEGVLAAHPENPVARLALAELALRSNDLPTAARWLEEMRAKDAGSIEARLALARVYLLQKRSDRADAVLREVDTLAAGRPDVVNAIGLLYLEASRYDEAGSRFRAAVDIDPGNPAYWLNLARAQLALDRRVLARESLEKAQAARPESIAVVGALVMLDLRDGRRDAAAQRIGQLRKQRPDDPLVSVLEGDYQMTMQQYEEAAGAYDRAMSRRPEAKTALKSYRARQTGKLGNATAPLESWIAGHPDDFAVQSVLAEAYQRGGQRERALEKYEFIVHNGPVSAIMLNNLAWLYYLAGDARAETTALRAYRLAQTIPSVADTYGWILVEKGKVAEGVQILETAAAAADGNPDIDYHYAAALARTGDVAAARQQLHSLLERSETFASQMEARRLLQELSSK